MKPSLLLAAALAAMPFAAMPISAMPAPAAPTFGTYGFDTSGMDRTIAPGDDFYGFANGGWAKRTPIPADRANYGMFTMLDDLSKQRTRDILEEAKADPQSRIGNAYASYLDAAKVEQRGMAPIAPWLVEVGKMQRGDYPRLLARAARDGIDGPFAAMVGQDDKQPERYTLSLAQAGLGMPDRDYYLDQSPRMREVRVAYVAHLVRVLGFAGAGADAAARAAAILAFETDIARVHWTRTDSRDADKTYNRMTVAELAKLAPGFDFAAMFAAQRLQPDALIVAQPSAVAGIARLVAAAPVAVLRDQLLVRSIDSFADALPEQVANERFAFYGTTLSGTPEREPRWKRAVGFVTDNLGDDVGRIYVARWFPPETKAAADALVRNVLAAMGRRIDALPWMAPETKAKAHAKLASFTVKIGYPDRWRDYASLAIDRSDLFGNMLRANRFAFDYNIGKLGKPIYRWEWFMTPMEINAYANFSMTEVVFPAAILQPPFFDPKADPAVNYGGIGAVIGHEISHHFDDQGSKYDAGGRLQSWWTEKDLASFKALTGKLVRQYDAYEPLPGLHVNGALTLGENIGDLAGLAVAHDAWEASLGGRAAPVIDGTTGEQRFFFGWAQVWRRSHREADLRQRLLTDPHAPAQYRADIVRNFDRWYDAFAPAPGGRLVLTPDARVRIW